MWKLVAQAIEFEKILKNNIAQSEDEDEIQSAITQFLCDFFAFLCLRLDTHQVKELRDLIHASPNYKKPTNKQAKPIPIVQQPSPTIHEEVTEEKM